MWWVAVFETRTGEPILDVTSLVESGPWSTRRNGQGSATHTLQFAGSGFPQPLVAGLCRGNKRTIVQGWGSSVAYAGVIEDTDWDEAAQKLTVQSKEFRAALAPTRMLFGVVDYQPSEVALTVSGRSYSSALRRLIQKVTTVSSEWALPVDVSVLPDTAGGFSAVWRKEEQLTFEDCMKQLEDDGCEIFFRPYLTSAGMLRWEPTAQVKVTFGDPLDLAVRAPGSLVLKPSVKFSTARLVTGVLGFGKGYGQDRPFAHAPSTGSGATDQPIRDVVVNFPDISDQNRLQAAVDAEYQARKTAVEQWSYGVHIWRSGPASHLPGRMHRLWTYGSARLADGSRDRRVIALSGDMGFTVTPEVQGAS